MSESFLLSLVFLGIIALIGFIGASFGIARGFVLTASIFGGVELGLWWGDRAGSRLSDWFGTSEETGRFLGSMFVLLASAFVLGIGASAVLTWGTPTRWGATLGILLGAANGALLIAMALRLYFLSYVGTISNDALDDSIVTRVLWGNFDWFILGFLLVASILLLYTRFSDMSVWIPDPSARAALPRPIPPPVPRPGASAYSRIDSEGLNRMTVQGPSPSNGTAARPAAGTIDDAIYAPSGASASPRPPAAAERTAATEGQQHRTELPSARNTVRFCPNCGMTLDASDHFCPDCGLTL